MELCTSTTVQSFSNLPTLNRHHNNLLTSNPNTTNLRLKPSLPLRLHSRLLSVRATSSEESGSNLYGGEEPGGGVVSTYEPPPPEKETYSQAVVEEAPREEESTVNGIDGQTQISEFLENFDIKLDNDDAYVYLLYGGGALVTLWLASAVVGAIDSIPLFPKLMEVVGLGYTIWFSTRYLIFKKDREELVAKVQVLKKQVLGSSDD